MVLFEVCCFSAEAARVVIAAGAQRLELCARRDLDGVSPSMGDVAATVAIAATTTSKPASTVVVHRPPCVVHCMVRPLALLPAPRSCTPPAVTVEDCNTLLQRAHSKPLPPPLVPQVPAAVSKLFADAAAFILPVISGKVDNSAMTPLQRLRQEAQAFCAAGAGGIVSGYLRLCYRNRSQDDEALSTTVGGNGPARITATPPHRMLPPIDDSAQSTQITSAAPTSLHLSSSWWWWWLEVDWEALQAVSDGIAAGRSSTAPNPTDRPTQVRHNSISHTFHRAFDLLLRQEGLLGASDAGTASQRTATALTVLDATATSAPSDSMEARHTQPCCGAPTLAAVLQRLVSAGGVTHVLTSGGPSTALGEGVSTLAALVHSGVWPPNLTLIVAGGVVPTASCVDATTGQIQRSQRRGQASVFASCTDPVDDHGPAVELHGSLLRTAEEQVPGSTMLEALAHCGHTTISN